MQPSWGQDRSDSKLWTGQAPTWEWPYKPQWFSVITLSAHKLSLRLAESLTSSAKASQTSGVILVLTQSAKDATPPTHRFVSTAMTNPSQIFIYLTLRNRLVPEIVPLGSFWPPEIFVLRVMRTVSNALIYRRIVPHVTRLNRCFWTLTTRNAWPHVKMGTLKTLKSSSAFSARRHACTVVNLPRDAHTVLWEGFCSTGTA